MIVIHRFTSTAADTINMLVRKGGAPSPHIINSQGGKGQIRSNNLTKKFIANPSPTFKMIRSKNRDGGQYRKNVIFVGAKELERSSKPAKLDELLIHGHR